MTDDCLAKALDLLARRPHFRRELEAKLEARGFPAEAVRGACDRLEGDGYLDDLACARELAEGRLRRKGYGPLRVRAELRRRGAPDEVVDEVAASGFGEGELELAREAAGRWLARHAADRARLARHLERRGFTGGVVRAVVGETDPSAAG